MKKFLLVICALVLSSNAYASISFEKRCKSVDREISKTLSEIRKQHANANRNRLAGTANHAGSFYGRTNTSSVRFGPLRATTARQNFFIKSGQINSLKRLKKLCLERYENKKSK